MRALENISDLESIAPHANALSDAYYEIEEHIAALQDVLAHMDDDEQLLNEMQERLFSLSPAVSPLRRAPMRM